MSGQASASEGRRRSGGPHGGKAEAAAPTQPAKGVRAFLFDASADDQTVELSAGLAQRLHKDQLLWVDVDASRESAVGQVRDLLDLDDADLFFGRRIPVRERGPYFAFRTPALEDSEAEPRVVELICIVSEAWLVTLHQGRLPFIDAFDEHVRSDSSFGALDAPGFAASLLEWELNEYFLALEAVQRQVSRIEESILSDDLNEALLGKLVALRTRVAGLREGLTPQRYVYATLAHPSFDVSADTRAAADFGLLNDRLEQAIQATDSARETIVGAFELYMTMTAQHTNDVMKVLTTVSVLLLPASLLAGIFGMNMLPHVFLHTWFFGIVIALMVGVGAALLLTIRRRGWL